MLVEWQKILLCCCKAGLAGQTNSLFSVGNLHCGMQPKFMTAIVGVVSKRIDLTCHGFEIGLVVKREKECIMVEKKPWL